MPNIGVPCPCVRCGVRGFGRGWKAGMDEHRHAFAGRVARAAAGTVALGERGAGPPRTRPRTRHRTEPRTEPAARMAGRGLARYRSGRSLGRAARAGHAGHGLALGRACRAGASAGVRPHRVGGGGGGAARAWRPLRPRNLSLARPLPHHPRARAPRGRCLVGDGGGAARGPARDGRDRREPSRARLHRHAAAGDAGAGGEGRMPAGPHRSPHRRRIVGRPLALARAAAPLRPRSARRQGPRPPALGAGIDPRPHPPAGPVGGGAVR